MEHVAALGVDQADLVLNIALLGGVNLSGSCHQIILAACLGDLEGFHSASAHLGLDEELVAVQLLIGEIVCCIVHLVAGGGSGILQQETVLLTGSQQAAVYVHIIILGEDNVGDRRSLSVCHGIGKDCHGGGCRQGHCRKQDCQQFFHIG